MGGLNIDRCNLPARLRSPTFSELSCVDDREAVSADEGLKLSGVWIMWAIKTDAEIACVMSSGSQ